MNAFNMLFFCHYVSSEKVLFLQALYKPFNDLNTDFNSL